MILTKRKKRVLVAACASAVCIALIAVLLVRFSLFWNAPYRRHWTFHKTPVETNMLFARPDEVVLIQGGWVKWLKEESISALYEEIAWFESASLNTVSILSPATSATRDAHRNEFFCVELRYDQRYKYVGEIKAFYGEEYDALLLAFDGDGVFVMPYRGWNYHGGNIGLGYDDTYSGKSVRSEYQSKLVALKQFEGVKSRKDPVRVKKEADGWRAEG